MTLESAAFGAGRLTPNGALLYVTDYLGSVRAVVDGKTGELYKAADYSAFGDEEQVMLPAQGYERGKASAASSSGKSINQLQQDVKKGKAPKGLKRFDRKHTEGGQEHVHFEDGSALNKDGSWKEGKYKLNKNQAEYLKDNGWDI